jgi:hypothetical protein
VLVGNLYYYFKTKDDIIAAVVQTHRLGDVGLIPAVCTGQEGGGPPAGTPNSANSCDIGGPAPAGI